MRFINVLSVSILFFFCGNYLNAAETNNNPFSVLKKTYTIKSTIDLKGQTVTIPSGSTVVFKKKGQIINGTIKGENAAVKADKHQIFDRVVLSGTFSAKMAYSEWFGAKDDCVLDENNKYVSGTNNLQAFRNLFCFDNVSIKRGCYLIEGGSLGCRNDQVINGGEASLKFLTKNICINIDGTEISPVRNVIIRCLNIIGCKDEYDNKTEWWHGINIGYVCNVKIERVTCDHCRGDGFYVGTRINKTQDKRIPECVFFNHVRASHNYRNGLSITRARNVKITNSEFCFTSGTLPKTGLDIEPNGVKVEKDSLIIGEVENIAISKCRFYGNENEGLLIANQRSINPSMRIIECIQVTDCVFDDDDITITGCADSKFDKLELINSVVKINGESLIRNLTLSNFRMVNTEAVNDKIAIELEYYRSKDWPVRSNIVLSDMMIEGYGGGAISVGQGNLITYKKFDGLSISGCIIRNCGKGIELGKSIKNLQFYNNKVDGNSVIPESVQLMGLSVFMFLMLATGGLALFMKKKK